MDKQNHTPDDDGDRQQPRHPELPEFSRRLGAPIATVKPVGKAPSQVTGRPESAQQRPPREQARDQGANLGVLPGPDGQPVGGGDTTDEIDPNSFYAQVGGRATFEKIVDVFYDQVAEDPHFRAHYPEEDLGPARERLRMFLEQYWGGPKTYQQRRGHPRLRMRHMPFRVDAEARDTWLKYMRVAVESANLSAMHQEVLWDYLDRAAHAMVNS